VEWEKRGEVVDDEREEVDEESGRESSREGAEDCVEGLRGKGSNVSDQAKRAKRCKQAHLENLFLDQQPLPSLPPAISNLSGDIPASEQDDERVEPGGQNLSDGVVRECWKLILEHKESVEALTENGYA